VINKNVTEVTDGGNSTYPYNSTAGDDAYHNMTSNSTGTASVATKIIDGIGPKISLNPDAPWQYYVARMLYMHLLCTILHYLSRYVELKGKQMMG